MVRGAKSAWRSGDLMKHGFKKGVDRRALLKAIGVASAAAAASTPADAAGFLFLAGPPTTRGLGGKTVINPNFLQTGGEFAFMNFILGTSSWSFEDNFGANSGNSGATVASDDTLTLYIDSNGYPTNACCTAHGGVKGAFYVPPAAELTALGYATTFRVQFTTAGNVTLVFGGDSSITVTNLTATNIGGNVYQQTISHPSPNGGRILFHITQNSNSDLSALSLVNSSETAKFDAGEVFGTQFKAKLTNAKIGVFRGMNWGLGSSNSTSFPNPVVKWADRKPQSYVYYAGDQKVLSYWAGVTTNSGDAYSVAAPPGWGGLVDKAVVHLRWNVTSAGTTPTLNVGSTGAIPIVTLGTLALVNTTKPTLNGVACLIYDADIGKWLMSGGGGSAVGNFLLSNGVPPETLLQLCSEVGMDPWYSAPHFTVDPITDYIPNLATYLKNNKQPWQKPYIETPNEIWNTATNGSQYAMAKAFAHWGSAAGATDNADWEGYVASIMGQAVNAAFGGPVDGTQYRMVLGQWLMGAGAGGPVAPYTQGGTQSQRIESTVWLSQGSPLPSGYSLTAAKEYVTDICVAPYFRHTFPSSSSIVSIAGTIASNGDGTGTLTITSVNPSGGGIAPGMLMTGTGVAAGSYVIGWHASDPSYTGTGGTGTYKVNTTAGTVTGASNTYNDAVTGYQVTNANAIVQWVVDSTNVSDPSTPTLPATRYQLAVYNYINNVLPAWYKWTGAHLSSTGRRCRLIAYEGGWECNGLYSGGNGDNNHISLSEQTKRNSSIGTYLTNLYNTSNFFFPACFQMGWSTFLAAQTLTGSISGNILTVTNSGTPAVSALISGTDVAADTIVTGVITAGSSYYVTPSQTAVGVTNYANPAGANPWGVLVPTSYSAESPQWLSVAAASGGT